jgi:twitching motility protein PilT
MHTNDASQSIDRMIDIFPSGQQQQIRLQLSQVLEAVLSQALLPRIAGGRIAAFEILLATAGIKRLIRDDKAYEIPANLEHGASEGKQTMDQALADLVTKNIVTKEEALAKSSNPAKFNELIR